MARTAHNPTAPSIVSLIAAGVAALAVAITASPASAAAPATCTKFAAPTGSDSAAGTEA